jgi:sugar lactone lactonase YvrE
VLASPSGTLAARDDWSPVMNGFVRPTGIARSKDSDEPFGSVILKRKVYVADSGNHTIRRIDWILSFEACPQGRTVTTLAGNPGHPGFADGTGSAARFDTPRGIATAKDGSIYVSDSGNHVIRKITPDGVVTTVAGTPGVAGSDDTHLNTPTGIDVDDSGNVFFVDTFNHVIRELTPDGKLTTVAGTLGVSGFADGDASTAKFNAPVGLKVAPDGSLVVADTGNNVIRRLALTR